MINYNWFFKNSKAQLTLGFLFTAQISLAAFRPMQLKITEGLNDLLASFFALPKLCPGVSWNMLSRPLALLLEVEQWFWLCAWLYFSCTKKIWAVLAEFIKCLLILNLKAGTDSPLFDVNWYRPFAASKVEFSFFAIVKMIFCIVLVF